MRLWLLLHYQSEKGRIPRQVPGHPPPYGPPRIPRQRSLHSSQRLNMSTYSFYESIGWEIDWAPYFLPIGERPSWINFKNYTKPRRPVKHNEDAIRLAHREGRRFPADQELKLDDIKSTEHTQVMKLWVQLHLEPGNGRTPRQLPGLRPPRIALHRCYSIRHTSTRSSSRPMPRSLLCMAFSVYKILHDLPISPQR